MKKIMFNERYGLETAVLLSRKTMTRRILEVPITDHNSVRYALLCDENMEANKMAIIKKYATYQVGEEVAVAQSYETLANSGYLDKMTIQAHNAVGFDFKAEYTGAGWANKMFVRADLMPHRIRITDIMLQRLQDISDEDCLREGLIAGEQEPRMFGFRLPKGTILSFLTPRAAFAALIDRVSGKGTWESNPWVYAYEFELVQ